MTFKVRDGLVVNGVAVIDSAGKIDYAQLKNTPVIPTNLNQLTNGPGYITGSSSITGNAATATKLQTARLINGVSFDGSADITITASGTDNTKVAKTGDTLTGALTMNVAAGWAVKVNDSAGTTLKGGLYWDGTGCGLLNPSGGWGLRITPTNVVEFNNDLLPVLHAAQDIGSATRRIRNLYTSDLHLSNGIGDYTVVEGEEELFLYNNKTNKVFKFALIEVDPSQAPAKMRTD